ncbi:MAG: dihydrodipicolinate synthase family protein [Terriglobales bacterium]
MLLHGIFPPITTPFYSDGRVYFRKLEANVERYSKTPVTGLVVLGSTGEAILLSDDERREVLRTAREATAPEKVLVAGTGIESAAETLRLTEYAASLGYDVAMVRTPHYYKQQMKPENMLAFYRTVADRSPLPVIIYNFPQATGYDISAEVVIALAEHPNLIGIKESGGDINKVKAMVAGTRHVQRTVDVTEVFEAVTGRMRSAPLPENVVPANALAGGAGSGPIAVQAPAATPALKTRTKDAGFQVMVGSAHLLQSMLNVGAVGAILAFACCAPTACFEIYTAWKDNDVDLAREKQERIAPAALRVVGELGVPGLKHALDFNGYYGGPPRLPLLSPTAEVKAEIERLLEYIRN